MVNPASIMKIRNAKIRFQENHPKFVAFCNAIFSQGIEEGTVIELTVTRPGQTAMKTNIKVQESDVELLNELMSMADSRS